MSSFYYTVQWKSLNGKLLKSLDHVFLTKIGQKQTDLLYFELFEFKGKRNKNIILKKLISLLNKLML